MLITDGGLLPQIPMPMWLAWDVMDVRRVVGEWHDACAGAPADHRTVCFFPGATRVILACAEADLADRFLAVGVGVAAVVVRRAGCSRVRDG